MASHAIDSVDPATERSPIAGFGLARQAMIVAACFAATLSAALIYDVLPPIMADLSAHFGGGSVPQGMIGTVEVEFFGLPSISLSE